jgi:hypothetical protein
MRFWRVLPAGERLHHEDLAATADGDIQFVSLLKHFAIDEDSNVFSNRALIVQHVTAQLRVIRKDGFKRFTQRRRIDSLPRWTIDMLSKLGSEFNMRHASERVWVAGLGPSIVTAFP